MNIISKTTLQWLRKNRTRTIVTIIGVILSASMIMAVTSFISSLQNYLLQMAIDTNGDWHAIYYDVDASFAQKINKDDKIKNTALVQNVGYAVLEGGQNTNKPYLFIAGFSSEAFDTLPVKLTSGRLPENTGEIVIPDHIRSNGGVEYKIGDTLTLETGSRMIEGKKAGQNTPFQKGDGVEHTNEVFLPENTKTYKIVGICQRPAFEGFSAPGYTVITRFDPETAGSLDVLFKMKSLSKSIYSYVEDAAGGDYGFSFNSDYMRASGISGNNSYNAVLYSLGSILIALIMTGSILLIFNSFSISVSERTRQFGILSSVGATKKQLRKSVLFEGACIGLVGIPLGILAGVGGIGITLKFVGVIFDSMSVTDVPLTLSVSIAAVIVTILVGSAVILVSAYIPAKRAAKRSAIDSIRQTDDIKISARSVKTSKLTKRLFGLEGTLARKNFKRNKKRYRSTVISLFVSIVLFVSASAFGMYLRQGTSMSFEVTDYDLAFSSAFLDDKSVLELYEKLKNAPGVYESGYQLNTTIFCEVTLKALTDRFKDYYQIDINDPDLPFNFGFGMCFIDDTTYRNYLNNLGLPEAEYMGAGAKLPAVGKVQGYDVELKRVVSFDMFNNKGVMSLQTSFDSGQDMENKTLDVNLVTQMPSGFSLSNFSGLMVFAPYSLKEEFPLSANYRRELKLVFMSDNTKESAAEMDRIIQEAGISVDTYMLFNAAEIQESSRNILLIINVFTYGFITLMSLITIANVFNTISTNINLRRREFAMLRSVGMTNRGFNKMMVFECAFYGIKSLLYGLPVAAAITWLIYNGVTAGVDVAFSLPWESIGISVFSVFFVVFVTMLYSVGKLKKENTVDALKNEMM